jgi:hypothetical protein
VRRLVGRDCADLRREMLLSGLLGLIMMAVSFVFLEWLNHAVVNAGHFMRSGWLRRPALCNVL